MEHPVVIYLLIFCALCILIYSTLIIWFWYNFSILSKQKSARPVTNGIKLSVVIALRNESGNVTALLSSLRSQVYADAEFILVDDNSDDGTFEILQQYAHTDNRFKVFRNKGLGKKSAIQSGASRAIGEYLVFTDADCRLSQTWLSSLITELGRQETYLLILPVNTEDSSNLSGKLQELDFLSLIASTFGSWKRPFLCNGANLCVKRSVFFDLNPFEDNIHIPTGDDIFLLQKMKARWPDKIHLSLNPESWVFTKVKSDWRGFFEQRIRWSSKTINYRDNWTVFISVLVLLAAIVSVVSLLMSPVGPFQYGFLLVFVLKIGVDSLLLITAARYFQKRRLIALILPASVAYVLYVPLVAVIGVVRNLITFKKDE